MTTATRSPTIAHMFGPRSSLSTTVVSADAAGSCSQTRMTVHPAFDNAASASRSRSTLRRSLGVQYHSFVVGNLPWSGHACQKQPSTNTATRRAVNTMSGRTGLRPSTAIGKSFRNRYPSRCNNLRSSTSGLVSVRLIARMLRPRPGEDAGGTPLRLSGPCGSGSSRSIPYPAFDWPPTARHDSPPHPTGSFDTSLRRRATA